MVNIVIKALMFYQPFCEKNYGLRDWMEGRTWQKFQPLLHENASVKGEKSD